MKSWKGYVFFQDTIGFQYAHGDVFCLPSSAIFSALSPKCHWMTLTHEISHAIFTVMDIDAKHAEIILEGARRALTYYGESLDNRSIELSQNQFFELFAQWFDYYHFFNEDHDFYQKSIWISWLYVPFVHKDQTEYIFRSFAVFVLRDISALHESVYAVTESDFLKARWRDFISFVRLNLPETEQISFEEKEDAVLALAADYLFPFSFLALEYRLDSFRHRLNEMPANFQLQIETIFSGAVIPESIANPFLLVREATRRATSGDNESIIRAASAALIFTLRDASHFDFRFPSSE